MNCKIQRLGGETVCLEFSYRFLRPEIHFWGRSAQNIHFSVEVHFLAISKIAGVPVAPSEFADKLSRNWKIWSTESEKSYELLKLVNFRCVVDFFN